jgi:hypothetical protein
MAMAIMLNAKKNVSNAQLGRDLGLPYKTAWSLALRIRTAMMTDPEQNRLFHGIVEMDETYIGGKPRKGNGKLAPVPPAKRGRGTSKMAVVGIVERGGRATARVLPKSDLGYRGLSAYCKARVDVGSSIVMTDEWLGYKGFGKFVMHAAVNHNTAYVSGDTHTNTIEGFWALVKRSWYGQHHHYSSKWADHFLGEMAYKYCHRRESGKAVFDGLLRQMAGVAS